MKRLNTAVKEYLALRRALGYKLRHFTWWLPDFVSFLDEHGSSVITTELALKWACQPANTTRRWWAVRLSAIRQFAKHHRASDPRTEIPPADLIPCRSQRLIPHFYTEDEVTALMREVQVPIQVHSHATSGMATATYVEAVRAGAGAIDCAISVMSGSSSQPAVETMAAIFAETDYHGDLDLDALRKICKYFEKLAPERMLS